MRVLALDPGYDRLGLAVLERQSGKETLLYSTCVLTNRADSLPDRLLVIGTRVAEALTLYTPSSVALETLFFNKNQKTAIGVAQVRGIIIYLAKLHGATIEEYSPQQIKVAVTGYGKSDKEAVTSMVKRLVSGVPDGMLDDEYDAIAVGLTALAHAR
jgi:crossover junction endodeoxyribonuclease RuvC